MTDGTGAIIAKADRCTESVIIADYDLHSLHMQRIAWGVFRDRRPELYDTLMTKDGSSTTHY